MEMEQDREWKEAQSIEISVDLVSAAKRQLQYLAAVDRNRWLYEGQGLDRAIHRYNTYWLPLLAEHCESPLCEGPLVVPFDCEWIWHCHRLNPARYKSDCEEFYGRILDNNNVVSTVGGTSGRTSEEIWKTLYPDEPYELDSADALNDNNYGKELTGKKHTTYDLVSAVRRQSPFFYQVSRLHMNDNSYLEGAVARYKGFLHLIKRNKERSIKSFSVPTYDIDLIWHTHQLHPAPYCKELVAIMGKVLEHDDNDSDRTKGQKLDVGFSGTTKKWEEMYGSRYWRAGAMYRGGTPSPVRTTPYSRILTKDVAKSNDYQKIRLPKIKVLEVMLEIIDVRNLPEGHKGNLSVSFSKTQPDAIFNAKRRLTILTESGEKQVAVFNCEPTGHLLFELISLPSNLLASMVCKTMGTTSISLEEFFAPGSYLTMEKWLDMVPNSSITDFKPIGLRVAVSVTVPTPAPYALHITCSRPFFKSSCLFPSGRVPFSKSWTRVVDEAGDLVVSLKLRDLKKFKGKKMGLRRDVIGVMKSGEKCTLAEFAESGWSLVNSPWSLQFPSTNNDDGHLLELIGPQNVKLFHGGRLDYESKHCEKHKRELELESHLMTAVEFSSEHPYGRAVALLDLKSGTAKVKEEWFLLPGSILTFVLGNILRKEGYRSLVVGGITTKVEGQSNEVVHGFTEVEMKTDLTSPQKKVEVNREVAKGNATMPAKGRAWSGSCGGGCGSGCGNDLRTMDSGGCGGCGGSGGGGCGNMVKTGGCGGSGGCGGGGGCGGCGGSGCGNMVKTGGCGGCGGCGSGGCGNMIKTGACGGCGGGCGDMAKTGGCGGSGGCGGGCGNKLMNGDSCINGQSNQDVIKGNEILVA